MLTDRDSLLRKLHELRSEHRDLDTVIARLAEQGAVGPTASAAAEKAQADAEGRDRLAGKPADPGQHRLTWILNDRAWTGAPPWSASSWAASRTGPPCATPPKCWTQLGVPHEARIVSAHRTPDRLAVCTTARGARPAGHHRRRRRGGASARHVRGLDASAGAGRAGRIARAEGHGQPAFDRPDAGRHSGRHAGDRPRRRGQRRAAGGRDPGADRPGAGGAAGCVPCGADRVGGRGAGDRAATG